MRSVVLGSAMWVGLFCRGLRCSNVKPSREREGPSDDGVSWSAATSWPLSGLLVLAGSAFVTILTEALPAGVLPAMSADLDVTEARAGLPRCQRPAGGRPRWSWNARRPVAVTASARVVPVRVTQPTVSAWPHRAAPRASAGWGGARSSPGTHAPAAGANNSERGVDGFVSRQDCRISRSGCPSARGRSRPSPRRSVRWHSGRCPGSVRPGCPGGPRTPGCRPAGRGRPRCR